MNFEDLKNPATMIRTSAIGRSHRVLMRGNGGPMTLRDRPEARDELI